MLLQLMQFMVRTSKGKKEDGKPSHQTRPQRAQHTQGIKHLSGLFLLPQLHMPLIPFFMYSTIMATGSTLSILCDVFQPGSQAKPHLSRMRDLHRLQKGDFYRQGISAVIQKPITILHSLIEVHAVRLLTAIQKDDVLSRFFQNTYSQVFPGK